MANRRTLERWILQAAMIRSRKPREQLTGPKSEDGKMRSNENALELGGHILEAEASGRRLRDLIMQYKHNLTVGGK